MGPALPLLAFSLLLGAAPEPVALPARLSMREAVRIFRSGGFDLLLAEAAERNAEGELRAARALPNPAVSLAGGSSFTDPAGASPCPVCPQQAWNVSLSDQAALFQSLTGKRGLRIEVAQAALEGARRSRADAERILTFQVRRQYLAAVLATGSLAVAREGGAAADRTFELDRTRYRAGAVSEAEEARAETAALEAAQAVQSATQALGVARIALAFLLGVRGTPSDFEVDAEFPPFAVPPRLASAARDALIRQALDRRPDLEALRRQRDRAEAALAQARRSVFPDVTLTLSAYGQGRGESAIQPPTFLLGVGMPLPILDQSQGAVAKAEADLEAQTAALAKGEAQVVSDVGTAEAGWRSARDQVERMEGRLLDRARRARDLVRLQYEKGTASLLELLDAQRTFLAVSLEALNDRAAYWTAVYQLDAAVGWEGPE